MPPVDSAGITHRLGATGQRLGKTRIHLESRWPLEQLVVELSQSICIDRGVSAACTRLIRFCILGWIVLGAVNLAGLHRRLNSVEIRRSLDIDLFDFFGGDDSFGDETIAPHFARGRMRANFLVQRRLSERWLVRLVVSVTTIADDVDQEVLRSEEHTS